MFGARTSTGDFDEVAFCCLVAALGQFQIALIINDDKISRAIGQPAKVGPATVGIGDTIACPQAVLVLAIKPENILVGVKFDGVIIALGPKEFKILSLLMERPGQVYSRAQVLDHVWGHGVFVEDRTVDVHFSRLRKVLNQIDETGNQRPDLIRTVRGSGYALTSANVSS